MVDSMKFPPPTDLRGIFSLVGRRRTRAFAYGFVVTFLACTAYIALNPTLGGTPWLSSYIASTDYYRTHLNSFLASASASTASYRSQFSALISTFFPNSTLPVHAGGKLEPDPEPKKTASLPRNRTGSGVASPPQVSTGSSDGSPKAASNSTGSRVGSPKVSPSAKNSSVGSPRIGNPAEKTSSGSTGSNRTGSAASKVGVLAGRVNVSSVGSPKGDILAKNTSTAASNPPTNSRPPPPSPQNARNASLSGVILPPKKAGSPSGNGTSAGAVLLKSVDSNKNKTAGSIASLAMKSVPPASLAKSGTNRSSSPPAAVKQPPASPKVANRGGSGPKWNIESMKKCNLFHGKWVRDNSYPLYAPGSCPHIDESFNCFTNGRPELSYQKLRWQPHGCYIPRLNATDMLERLRGKRLVYVGDSLNRNMWESMVCVLTNAVKDKSRVFEASGKHEFKTDGSYSFIFKDYNFTVEFFRSVFLVQEWELIDTSGHEKETLRLDMIAKSSSRYKDADLIVFNTGHWWTHDKTSKGKDYYQEGNRVYNQLNVADAFHKALNTWAKWVDANINPKKTIVFFRGYSASHFSGGQWNSGGQCDAETEPIRNEKFLAPYPPKMDVLESVLTEMKTTVQYLNITRMTDYRKDAHPSIYRKPNLTEDERRAPDRFQDCSHWCLPGVPDSWNELLYAKLLIEQHKVK